MAIEKIIVLEDEAVIRKHLTELLQRKNFLVAQADSVSKAKQLVDKDDFDLIFADVRLPDGHGTEVLEYCQLKATPPLVALMTAYASVESAVECMKGGAFDYLIKPFSDDQVDVLLKKAGEFHQLLKVNQHLSAGGAAEEEHQLLGNSPAIQQLNDLIRKVARTQATVVPVRNWFLAPSTKTAQDPNSPSSPLIVRQFPTTWSRVNSLVMKRELLPERYRAVREGLSWRMVGQSSWMRSVKSLRWFNPSS